MVGTSVVTYTFSIGSFVVSPWSRYGPSVDWGVAYSYSLLLQVFPFDNFLVDNTYYMIYVGLMGDLR